MPASPARGQPPPLKASNGSVVQELLQRLEIGKVSVDELMGSLDDEIDREANARSLRQRPAVPPARCASRYMGPPSNTPAQARGAEPEQCSRCAVLELQVRSLTQSLHGLCTHFTNQVLATADDASRGELLDLALGYLQPFAHIDQAIAEACLGLRTVIGTVGEPAPSPTRVKPAPLKLCIVGAKGLRNVHRDGGADPYCICTVPGKPGLEFRTPFISDTNKPIWNFEVEFEYQHGDDLDFKIFHHNESFEEVLGEATLASSQFSPLGFDGALKLSNTGNMVTRSVLNVKVELPCSGKCMAWPPTVEGLVDHLMQTRARLVDAEKQGFVDSPKPKPPKKAAGAKADALQRTDPDDGKAYTLKQMAEKYKGRLKAKELTQYWEKQCKPLEETTSLASPELRKEPVHMSAPPDFQNMAYPKVQREPSYYNASSPLAKKACHGSKHEHIEVGMFQDPVTGDMWF